MWKKNFGKSGLQLEQHCTFINMYSSFEANGNSAVSMWVNALVLGIMDLSAEEASFIVGTLFLFKFVQTQSEQLWSEKSTSQGSS